MLEGKEGDIPRKRRRTFKETQNAQANSKTPKRNKNK
jgi:hypothetical protein